MLYEFYNDRLRSWNLSYFEILINKIKLSNFYKNDEERRRTAIITGSSGTIGRQIVNLLREANFNVIAVSHSSDFVEYEQCDAIHQFFVDFFDFSSVFKLVETIIKEIEQIDLIICNAAIMLNAYKLNDDCIESHFAINLISHAILINQLSPYLIQNSRIIFIASSVAYAGDINETNLDYKKASRCVRLGGKSCRELNRSTDDNETGHSLVCSLHPGCVPSNLYSKVNLICKILIYNILAPFMRTSKLAAAEILATAFDDSLVGGCYYEHLKVVNLRADISFSVRRKLFEEINDIIKKVRIKYSEVKNK
ncbi:unnamed protein product [Dracunculus medinensis]|uniref:SDR family NAD(P)-dependent oxidoreductase n=1 Tax=Dracunculus medinensis TaxID=318479 RepID=A0A158Q4M5_DRAME|nr:unnamed protein product [Dracunculus medinensis]